MDKLSKSLLQRKLRKFIGVGSLSATPEGTEPLQGPALEHRLVARALTTLFTETEFQAGKRTKMSEDFTIKIAEVLKEFNREKLVFSKKNVEFGAKYHHEMLTCFDELSKKKTAYRDASFENDAAQKKYEEASKKPKTGLSALKSLVTGKDHIERVQRLLRKSKAKIRFQTECRNDYIFALMQANKLNERYHKEDLPAFLKKMDGTLYTLLSKTFTEYTVLETDMANVSKECALKIGNEASKITREKDLELFFKEFAGVFLDAQVFTFEASGTDSQKNIVVDEITKISLGQKLGVLLAKEEALKSQIASSDKELEGIAHLLQAYQETPSFGNTSTALEKQGDIINLLDYMHAQECALSIQIVWP